MIYQASLNIKNEFHIFSLSCMNNRNDLKVQKLCMIYGFESEGFTFLNATTVNHWSSTQILLPNFDNMLSVRTYRLVLYHI